METVMDLGKQVGPLPLGAWLAVVGTGVGVALWARGPGSGTVADTTSRDNASTFPVEPGSEADVGTGPGWVAVPPPSTAPPGATPPQDNDEWGRQAINYLVAQGYDPAMSQAAIGTALQGGKMSVRYWALWSVALRGMGAPPFPVDVVPPGSVPGPVVPSIPPPKPPTAPPKHPHVRYYIVKPGDSLAKIAQRFYHDRSKWHRIYNANNHGQRRADGTPGMIRNPNVLRPGWKLIIPN